MAAKRLYDPPNVQLVELLREARSQGLDFTTAWLLAVRPGKSIVMSNSKNPPAGAIRWPTDRSDREAWRGAILSSAEGWRRAYDREPPAARERALGVLADAIGALEVIARERAVAEGIGGAAALASAA